MESEPAPRERTPCPHCGRETVTVGRGACGDCWKAKVPGGHPVLLPKEPRTEKFLDVDLHGWFELHPILWLGVAATTVGMVVLLIVRLVF